MKAGCATVAQIAEFDEVIDARSPAEYAEDRVPGASNCPTLDDAQRARVGTLYAQVSPFEARKLGGAMVARNIADHLEQRFADRDRAWRPLVYCWRGGQRSGSFVTWMRLIGWDAAQMEGGYKSYRRHVVARLAELPGTLRFRVVCGATGSGKTRILEALAAEGAQVLDLERLAAHKGSVLGALPGSPQPTQKWFESQLHAALAGFDPAREVWVEAESRKIGDLQVPQALIGQMRESACVVVEATRAARLDFLLRDYAYLGEDVAALQTKIDCLKALQSNETLARWKSLAADGDLHTLFAELIDQHYDRLYERSQDRNYRGFPGAPRFGADDLRPAAISRLAQAMLAGPCG
jgi:tRNA 2-selenouridine synthase